MSTMESKYNALSELLCTALPLYWMLLEIKEVVQIPNALGDTIRINIHEDNSGALSLCKMRHLSSRTKYYHVASHWFWAIVDEDDNIYFFPVESKEQHADCTTKGLGCIEAKYLYHRYLQR